MNRIIKQQLSKCRVAKLPQYEDSTVHMSIPKGSALTVTPYQVNNCYLIELAEFIIHPAEDYSLAVNWNGGSIPPCSHFNAQIEQVMGKMIKFVGQGVDSNTNMFLGVTWEGWVPQNGIKLIRKLD